MRRSGLRAIQAVLFVVLGLWVLRAFVGDVYRVDSGSMRPTLFGGRASPDDEEFDECVFVRYAHDFVPDRFDLVVFRSPVSPAILIKRVVGLPGEEIRILDGDLLVNGRRLNPSVPRPDPIPVFDDRHQNVEEFFEFRRPEDGRPAPWSRSGRVWHLDATPIPQGSAAGTMFFHPDLRDDYLDLTGRRIPGRRQVNDGILELELRVDEVPAAGALLLRLVEEGDTFEARIELEAGGEEGTARLLRWNPETLRSSDPSAKRLVLSEVPVRFPPGRWLRASFANVDNCLSFRMPELGLSLNHVYEHNVPYPGRKPAGRRSVGHRAAFGGEALRASFRSIRVLRDLYYTSAGRFGVERPVNLAGNELFVLGDNSATSTDSRHFGPIDLGRLVGRPLAVIWPSFRPLPRPRLR